MVEQWATEISLEKSLLSEIQTNYYNLQQKKDKHNQQKVRLLKRDYYWDNLDILRKRTALNG